MQRNSLERLRARASSAGSLSISLGSTARSGDPPSTSKTKTAHRSLRGMRGDTAVTPRPARLAHAASHQGGLGGRHAARREGAAARLHRAEQIAVGAADGEVRDEIAIIRAGPIEHAV